MSESPAVIVDTRRSVHARLRPVAVEQVQIDDAFWAPRMQTNRDITLPAMHQHLVETGRIANFRYAAGSAPGPHVGREFNDSDVYKWLEAAAWAIASGGENPALLALIDQTIAEIAPAVQPDGYLNTYFMFERAALRWTDHDLHEMYCAGHLFQAAVAHARATGSTSLLAIATRVADHIDATFGPEEQGKRRGTDGHPEVELALVELARQTGDARYTALAGFLLDVRGHGLLGNAYDRFGVEYHQDHKPYRELTEIVGHAVRAVYLNAGAADLRLETGAAGLETALHALWASMTERKMYASGGIGSRHFGEAFGPDYELSNALAYTETCAAIGSMMWAWRMALAEADGRYLDIFELQLYNAMLAGASLDGQTFFYENPLEDDGKHRRSAWFEVSCCPTNVARTLASLPGYVYTTSDDGAIWVQLYLAGTATIPLPDGRAIDLRTATRYPWDGAIDIEVGTAGDFGLRLRIPGWCAGWAIAINGIPLPDAAAVNGYADIRRSWAAGDLVSLTLPMPVRQIESHPFVTEDAGRVALLRGPLLYCLEQADNPAVDLREVAVPADARFVVHHQPELLSGVTVLTGTARLVKPPASWANTLYRQRQPEEPPTSDPVTITAVPYYAWANREAGPMRVWLQAHD